MLLLDPGCFSQRPSRESRWRHVLGADRGPGFTGPYSCLVIHRLWVYEKHTCLDAYMQSAALMFYIFTFSLIFLPLQECLQGGYTRHQPVPTSPRMQNSREGMNMYTRQFWPPESWSMIVTYHDACSVQGMMRPRPCCLFSDLVLFAPLRLGCLVDISWKSMSETRMSGTDTGHEANSWKKMQGHVQWWYLKCSSTFLAVLFFFFAMPMNPCVVQFWAEGLFGYFFDN